MRVLIVEDTVQIAEMLRVILDHADVESTMWTKNFEQLLDSEPWQGVDVALVDLMLAGVDGEEIIRYLADHHPDIRRFVLSAIGHQRAHLSEIATVLSKPFDPRVLLNALGLRRE